VHVKADEQEQVALVEIVPIRPDVPGGEKPAEQVGIVIQAGQRIRRVVDQAPAGRLDQGPVRDTRLPGGLPHLGGGVPVLTGRQQDGDGDDHQ